MSRMRVSPDDDFTLELELDELAPAADAPALLARKLAARLGGSPAELPPLEIRKRSLDARHGRVRFHVVVGAAGDAPLGGAPVREGHGPPVVIVGGGPAGLFCAYQLARAAIPAVIVDRGKPVQARRRDLKGLTQHGRVDPDSNYCYGEGGAGTYSDGKLYTRSHKRGDVRDVIEILATHGAPHDILVDARPHIGSNKLPRVITALRQTLASVGSEIRFGARAVDLVIAEHHGQRRAIGVRLADGGELTGRAVVIASGHSAHDVHDLLGRAGVRLEAKPFAMGVRIEHPQPLIDRIQYGRAAGHPALPAAAYKLAFTPDDGRGAFSFCMCPGGWIVPAATEPDGVVVNGMSLSRRDSPFANAGLVVTVAADDFGPAAAGPLAGIELQRRVEQAAFRVGGGRFRAPAQRLADFLDGRASTSVGASSYRPGLAPADLTAVLPEFVAQALRGGLRRIGARLPGFLFPDAMLVAAETRTSAPVRLVRDAQTLESPSLGGLFPCGEGAGYAGGIISAALDGARVAAAILSSGGAGGS